MKLLSLCAALGLVCALRAAPLERDLGGGLVYDRVHELPADLPAVAPAGRHACILDVRYVRGNSQAGAALLAWLKRSSSLKTPVLLLANQETSDAVLAPLNAPDAVMGLVILGAATAQFDPDIGLRVSASAERKAYEALENGASIESLYVVHTDKPRNDEETLEKARHSEAGADEAAPEPAPKRAAPPALIDPVLQRAVQLCSALTALRRI